MGLTHRTNTEQRRSRGFTLLEVLLVVGMIVLLAGLLLIAARYARQSAQHSADRASVTSLKTAITKFKQDFGFVPHLVKQSPDGTSIKPLVLISTPNNAPKRWVFVHGKRATFSHTEPRATLDSIRMAKNQMFFSSEKAKQQLGYQHRPAFDAKRDAVNGFKDNNYCK